jgi:tRNA threonylcarbamoyladenosine biosynthesis protein TsaE
MRAKRKAQGARRSAAALNSESPVSKVDRDSRFTIHELQDWGRGLGEELKPPVVVTLEGELGAGKTTLAQSICAGVGIREDVTSPTFALVNQYESDGTTVYHLDLYRLRGPDDLTNLGWDDIVNSDSIVLVEWPDRAGDRVPPDAIRVRLQHVAGDESRRRLTIL